MIKLYETGAYYADGKLIPDDGHAAEALAAMGRARPEGGGAQADDRVFDP